MISIEIQYQFGGNEIYLRGTADSALDLSFDARSLPSLSAGKFDNLNEYLKSYILAIANVFLHSKTSINRKQIGFHISEQPRKKIPFYNLFLYIHLPGNYT